MKVSVEFDKSLITAIDRAATIQKISRDAAFRDALEAWVAHRDQAERRLDLSVLELDSDFIPFEAHRPGPEAMPEFRWRKSV